MTLPLEGAWAKQPASAPHNAADARHVPGEEGIWIFIFGDLLVFAALFLVFLYYKGANPLVFEQSQTHMNQVFGAINTLVLLSSSWFVASAIQALRDGRSAASAKGLTAAMICGGIFAVIKYFEYGEKIHAHLTLNTDRFFTCYYIFTAIHLLHVLLGMTLLSLMIRAVRRKPTEPGTLSFAEVGASFWHMVDLLWVALFALFYLLR
jgi:nitric oxide reductase NorE protein